MISGGPISSYPLSGAGGYALIEGEDEFAIDDGTPLSSISSILILDSESGVCINPLDGDLFASDGGDLQVPVIYDFVLADRLKRVTKPAIPHLIDQDPALGRILQAIKENVHYTEARAGGLMELLEDTATSDEIIDKINEILDRMQT